MDSLVPAIILLFDGEPLLLALCLLVFNHLDGLLHLSVLDTFLFGDFIDVVFEILQQYPQLDAAFWVFEGLNLL